MSVKQVADDRKLCSVLVFGRGDAEDFALKGFDIAGKAVATLTDTRLVFVGAPNGKHEEIAKRLNGCGVSGSRLRVRGFLQNRDSLKRLFQEVDLVLMPSRTEGFGLTGLEALSAGLPVLASQNSGFGETLSKVTLGLSSVIHSEDPTDWATAIKKIWDKDRKKRLEEAETVRDSYKEKYDWAKQIKDLLKKMISLDLGDSSDAQSPTQTKGGMLTSAGQAFQQRSKDIPEHHIGSATSVTFIHVLLMVIVSFLLKRYKGIRRKSFAVWLKLLVLCCLVGILEHKSYKDGCPTEEISVPFGTKEFSFTDYLTTAREDFIGRRWLYQEIERTLIPARPQVSGVLIVGDSGVGKSALSAQLVCSRTSSRTIYDHVLGYHLCSHSDKNTQNGGKFVRNLAEMIARRLPEYGYIVSNSFYIQHSLNTDCVTIQDPVGCFEQTILTPMRRLTNEPKNNWYIVIDALDECLTQSETSHSIVYLLKNKLPRFPSWLKLVMTSRNESNVSLNSHSIARLIIDPKDTRNMKDIELFLSRKFDEVDLLTQQVNVWFGDNSVQNSVRVIPALISKSQGNFLFLKEMLYNWKTFRAQTIYPYTQPETLGELYHSYFERLYSGREQFKPIRRILEVLVATFQPLTQKEIFDVLRKKEVNLVEDYYFKDRMKELRHFLRYGENDTMTIYHVSLTEWLTSESNRNLPFYVNKSKGHEAFCYYYFSFIADGDKSLMSKYILRLAQHIAHGVWRKVYVEKFLRFPSHVVNSSDPKSSRTLLHLAAMINSTDVLELLLRHFSCIDCIDNRGITPAFLAAEHGLVHNLALLVKRGAKVNRKTNSLLSIYKSQGDQSDEFDNMDNMGTPVLQSKSKFVASTMLHAAARGGHLEVVIFLLGNGANISTVDGVNLTALQIASENGHLGVVKALYQAGAIADQTALHHAAANSRLEVVKYLSQIGAADRCMRCNGSFYWLRKEKHRLQSQIKAKLLFRITKQCRKDKKVENCIGRGNITDFEVSEFFDDKHLLFCETALHAAVSAGHEAVVRELISRKTNALSCRDYTGRTPLHEAVRKNNSEIVKLLLKKDQTMIHKTCNHWQNAHEHNETKSSSTLSPEESTEYHGDVCHCGYTPLHLAARYGHWEVGEVLILGGAQVEAQDCFGATPLHVAACHNHGDFVDLLMHSNVGANINSRSSNGSTPLHSAAICGAVKVINKLLYHGANLSTVDDNGLSALHYAILDIRPNQLDQEKIVNMTNSGEIFYLLTVDRRGHLASLYKDKNLVQNTERYRWLGAFLNLILSGSDIDAVDIHGQTPLHLAAANGLVDAVDVLIRSKSKLDIRDKFGKTPLEIAVENSTVGSTTVQVNIGERFDDLRQYLRDHEMVVYLLLSSGVSFQKCNRSGESLLHHSLAKSQPYIAQLLLLKGASLNCRDNLGRTPLTALIHNGGDWADIPFQHLNDSVMIRCGNAFYLSAFHLLCYFTPKRKENNFFELISCNDQTCLSKKSHFTRAIESHRLKYKVIDFCLDAEGFTPLHRAAQGANLVAVRSLIKHGANLILLSPQGHDALTLALLHSGGNIWQNNFGNKTILATKDEVSIVALELLHHAMETRGFQIVCDSTKPELTLYHLAASRGLVTFIQEMFKEKERHQLDVNCPNKDGVTPLYLAKVFSWYVFRGNYNPWNAVVRIIEDNGGKMSFPSKDAEYNIIYNRLHGFIPSDMELNLRPDVHGFVLGLVSTFRNRQNTSAYSYPDSTNIKGMQIGDPSSKWRILTTLLLQLKQCSQRGCYSCAAAVAEGHILMCFLQAKRSSIYTENLRLSTGLFRSTVNSSKGNLILQMIPVKLFHLMRMWHKEVFKDFACIKMVFDKFQSCFSDDKESKRLIKQYQNSIPTWYLGYIRLLFEITFRNHIQRHSANMSYFDLRFLYHEYPNFIRERMGWAVHQSSLQNGSWPFDFLVNFSLGLYRQYDYLKVLNVGLESRTHIALYSNKIRKIFREAKKREGEKEGATHEHLLNEK